MSKKKITPAAGASNQPKTAEKPKQAQQPKDNKLTAMLQGFGAFLKKHWPLILRPVTVLVCICVAVSAILAVTNYYTGPVIAQADADRATAARAALLPADSFEKLEGEWDGVTESYRGEKAGETVGYVITGCARGYGGDIPVLVAFDDNGTVIGIQISGTEETQGLGSKVEKPSFKDQFAGLAAAPLTLNSEVQQVAGATISSRAALAAVNSAIDAYRTIQEG